MRGGILMWVLVMVAGCSRSASPSSQPAAEPLQPASLNWSKAEAAAHLHDSEAAISAAVRLVRLSGVTAVCVPEVLRPDVFAHLTVVSVGEQLALGFAQDTQRKRVVAPVLIDRAGEVTAPIAWDHQPEYAVLVRSDDPNEFPNVIVLPREVWLLRPGPQRAIMAKSMGKGRFDVIQDRRGISLAIVVEAPQADGSTRRRVGARFRWDGTEEMFVGPGANKYPEPPGGEYELDVEESPKLVAVGGIVSEPEMPETTSQPAEPMPY